MRARARRARRCAGHQGRRPGAEPGAAARRRCGRRARRLDLAPRLARARARHPHGAGRARRDEPHPGWLAGGRRRRRRRGAVDGVMRPRIFVTQPVAKSAIARLRKVARVTINPDATRILSQKALVAGVRRCDILFSLLHDWVDRDVIAANSHLRAIASQSITPDNIDVAEATRRGIAVTVVPPIVAEATADIAFGLMLMVARRMVEGERLVQKGRFPGSQSGHLAGAPVYAKTPGPVGDAGGELQGCRAHRAPRVNCG